MKINFIFVALLLQSCCTLSMNNIITQGSAEDLIDEQQTQDQKPSFEATIPVK